LTREVGPWEAVPETSLAPATVLRRTFRRPGPRAWVRVEQAATRAELRVNGQPVATHVGAWTPWEVEITSWLRDDGPSRGSDAAVESELELTCRDCLHVTNGFLPRLDVRWTGARRVEILPQPTPPRAPAAQRSATRGTQLLVDGRPLRVRGILHWGYYPELGKPWPGEEQMRREIVALRALGFNLIKFCLWVPPPRYYELCDELGMLVWQEYPVWDAPLASEAAKARRQEGMAGRDQGSGLGDRGAPDRRDGDDALLREFREFFLQDRAYPCIILRTLTCENDRVDADAAAAIIDLARELIPGCLLLDNSGWLCSERFGDFHDEHPYLHNAQWKYYGRRMRGKLSKPLLLGETMCADTLADGHYETGLAVRRYQIETLERELPDAGYVVNALRDIKDVPVGLFTFAGRPKYTPQQWAWHGERRRPAGAVTPRRRSDEQGWSREIPDPVGPIIGPRKGQWKCPEFTWWSPVVKVLDDSLPRALIERECVFELLSGRVLSHADGTRVLVEVWDVHSGKLRKLPLVIEFLSEGRWHVVSAFRHDTRSGRELWDILQARTGRMPVPPSGTPVPPSGMPVPPSGTAVPPGGTPVQPLGRGRRGAVRPAPPPEIGPLAGSSIVLEDWEMSVDPVSSSIFVDEPWPALDDPRRTWVRVKCDTPLVNRGANVFEGWATFRTQVDYPGGKRVLRCEAVGDYYEIFIDGQRFAEAGPRRGTWDGTRDIPREFELDLPAGRHEFVFRVRDWRAAGGMVGPVFLAGDLTERVF